MNSVTAITRFSLSITAITLVILIPYYFGIICINLMGELKEGVFIGFVWILGALLFLLTVMIGAGIVYILKSWIKWILKGGDK